MLAPMHNSGCHCIATQKPKQPRQSREALLISTNGMDSRRRSAETDHRRQRLQNQQSSPALQQSSHRSRTRPAPHSNPLPQTQWSDVPLPYRPRNWHTQELDSVPIVHIDHATSARNHLLTPSFEDQPERSRSMAATSRSERHRGDLIRDLLIPRHDEPLETAVDASRLYPQIRPYNARLSTISAPDELEFHYARNVNQSSVPDQQAAHEIYDLPSLGIPRSPTYPPTGRRRVHSAHGLSDAALADEQEARLFVAATAGFLGPEQAFRHSQSNHPSHSSQRRRAGYDDPPPLMRPVTTGDIGSPIQETPTTMYALRQLAQLPQSAHERSLQRAQTSASGRDLWLQPPAISMLAHSEAILGDVDSEEDFDDELPDYAESQAQAQAHQREEAARRAQELQRRWQQTGARRGL